MERDLCRTLRHFSDSCCAGYHAGGQQAGRSHRLRTSRYEYGVTDKPWTRLQLIYNGTGTRSSCDNRDNPSLLSREFARPVRERAGSSSHYPSIERTITIRPVAKRYELHTVRVRTFGHSSPIKRASELLNPFLLCFYFPVLLREAKSLFLRNIFRSSRVENCEIRVAERGGGAECVL